MRDERTASQTSVRDEDGGVAGLGGILITHELYRRGSRPPDHAAESRALAALAETMASSPKALIQRLVETALELCRADSAGISVLEPGGEHGVFRWHAIAGAFAPNLAGTMPKALSSCATVLESDAALLFDHPARHFVDLADAEPPIFESLLVPFRLDGRPIGTVWAMAHSPERKFDAEDARLLTTLSRFASGAYRMSRALAADEAGTARDRRVQERTSELASANKGLVERNLLRHVASNIPSGSLNVFDRDLRYLFAEGRGLDQVGLSSEQLVGKTLAEIFPPESVEYVEPFYRRAFAGETVEFELEVAGRWYTIRSAPLRDSQGAVNAVIALAQDITEHRSAQEALLESEERYRTLFESIDEGFFLAEVIFDEDHRPADILFLDANPAATRIIGQDFTGRRLREIDPNYEPYWYEIFGRVARTGERVREDRYASPNEAWYDFDVLKVGDEKSRRVAVVFQDITERKRAEEQLRESEARQAFLLELGDALRPLVSPEEVQEVATRLLGERIGASRVLYAEFVGDGSSCVIHADFHRGGVGSVAAARDHDVFGPFATRALRAGRPVVHDDVERSSGLTAAELEAYRAVQVRAAVTVPVFERDRPVGWLSVHQQHPRVWTREDVALVREVAERMSAAVERATAEGAVRKSEERLQKVLSVETVGVIFFSPDGAITGANDAFLRMGGYTREDLDEGRLRWDRLTPPEWMPETRRALEELETTGRITAYEKEYFRKNASRWPALFAGMQLSPDEAVEFVIDLTQLRAAEAAANREREQREQLEREFITNAAHELRTPLAGFIAAVEVLEAGAIDDPANREQFLDHLKREARRLARLCDSLLLLARAQSATGLPREPVQVRSLLEDVAATLHVHDGVAVEVRAPKTLAAETHRGLAELVLANVAGNAAKYTRTGAITLRARAATSKVVVEVGDTGPGMTASTAERAFDRFYRGGRRTADGFGLGLSIGKQAAAAIDGELTLEAAADGGALARLVLPRAAGRLPRR
ncbi:MAG: PAS domain S-box protein [Actinomycetota bacterium]|nr:PAS domain S-box protein [Actinomycetota bacterium]